MGAGASVDQVSAHCEGLGSSEVYGGVAKKCREIGIDAAMLADVDADGDEFDEICAELGVKGALQKKKLKVELKKFKTGVSGVIDAGAGDSQTLFVAEDRLDRPLTSARPMTAAEMGIEAERRPSAIATAVPVLASPVGLPQHLGSVANGQPLPDSTFSSAAVSDAQPRSPNACAHMSVHTSTQHQADRVPPSSHAVSPASGQQLTLSGKVMLGLGWDPVEGDEEHHDMDVGACLYGRNFIYHDFVYFNNRATACGSVQHSGDNRTGEGDGIDEAITIDLDSVPSAVFAIVVTINCFTGTFRHVQAAFLQVLQNNFSLGHYSLSGLFDHESLIVCRLSRGPGSEWVLTLIGEQIGGRSIIDYFHQDEVGVMADLRNEFKQKCGCVFDDQEFFQECRRRASRGIRAASVKKLAI